MKREAMDNSEESYISCLSDDCLLSIVSKLESESDRNAFGLTCKNWFKVRNVARKSVVFHFSYNPKVYKEHAQCLAKILARSPYLKLISLAGLTELPDSALYEVGSSGTSLMSLSLYCCFGITDDGLAQVSFRCPNLVIVELYRCINITDVGLESLSQGCHDLKSLNIGYCTAISDRGISSVFRNCRNISALIISYCRGVSGVGFRGCPSALSYLEAESCSLSPEGMLDIVSGGGLEYLNLYNLKSSAGLDSLGRVSSLTKLRFLNLRMCRYLTDDSVVAIASSCPLIEEWSLAVCHGVHLPGWSAIGLYSNKLRILHVNRCRNLCDQGLQALKDGCMRLEVLHINGCGKITNTGLALFSIARPSVKRVMDEAMSIGPPIEDLFRL
ncbi:F-box/LRR-repeat protein 12 [Lolium perenne]|uniref:F-box/LRR-repeat protein 12 n=1 Tax=Lolium perenne TaxID=4522 RepID=UPI0021F67677|nr:F-box/LRR-repeat protein 12 [Lolium perenne]